MPASSDIYSQIQQPKPINRLAELANVMQIQGLQGQQQLAQYTLKKAEREDVETNALNAAYAGALGADGKIDRNKLFASVAQGGYGSRLPTIQKTFADQDAAQTTAEAAKFKLANERYGIFQKTMGALKDMPNLSKQLVMEAGANLVQQGILPKEMYDGAVANMPDDPMQLRQRLTQGLATQIPPEKVFELFAPKPEKFDTGGQIMTRDMNPNSPTYGQNTGGSPIAKEQSPDSVASVAQSERNSVRVDQRAREQINASKAPAGYRWTADGKTLEPIPGGPAAAKNENASEGERNASGYASRMSAAEKIIGELASTDPKSQKPGLIEQASGGVGLVANTSRSDTRQQYRQAQEDWVRAKLRKESGAAIPNDEMEREITVYFPQIGDKPAVIKQKADARKVAEQAMVQAGGRASKAAASAAGGNNIDALLDKYK